MWGFQITNVSPTKNAATLVEKHKNAKKAKKLHFLHWWGDSTFVTLTFDRYNFMK